ncbi:MAG: beta-ketoacyl-[acyl-carrier-protein] synthase family protein [Ardenticatenaceae bacterium]|nr:beta-ketoacyl-[acyl-carrier-protein] synthase family protein [Ardenticatenaceae bacterium]HBY97964.1 beta-ketoacyl-[acyl-carrier-protein] synthase II [Chloroflexota bacterium]
MSNARRESPPRVVVTGIGAVTPIGQGKQGLWDGVRRGVSAVRRVTCFDPAPFRSQIAAEIPDFEPEQWVPARRARRMDRYSLLSLAAARQAVEDACLKPTRNGAERVGVAIGSALGGVSFAEDEHERFLVRRRLRDVSPYLALAVFGGAGPSNIAIALGIHGPTLGNANSCASGTIAIGEAFELIRSGRADVMLAGGAEAPLAPLTFGAFDLIRALSTRNDDPAHASRPFDRDRDGMVMGEGAAILVVEALDHALARDAPIYAELVGYGTSNDAYHMVEPRPDGRDAARAMTLTLEQAGWRPEDVDYINAHGSSTPKNEISEPLAIKRALGEAAYDVPVSGTKGLHAHALGASGAIEAAIVAQIFERDWLPPTTNLEHADSDLAYIKGEGLNRRVDRILSNSFGFGGINGVLAFQRFTP